jgi:hypothetical protein
MDAAEALSESAQITQRPRLRAALQNSTTIAAKYFLCVDHRESTRRPIDFKIP